MSRACWLSTIYLPCVLAAAVMWVPAATAQAYAPTFANAGFEEGDAGQEPPGWSLAGPNAAEYRVEVTQDTPSGGRQCARLFRDPAAAPIGEGEQRYGALQQELDAAPFRGKCVRLQASVRVGAGAPPTRASLWLSVGRPDGHLGHYDSTADGEIAGTEWSGYEALADVAEDANTVTLGVALRGGGSVLVDDVSLLVVGPSRVPPINPGFEEGKPGGRVLGWMMAGNQQGEYLAEVTRERPREGGQCAHIYRDPAAPPTAEAEGRFGTLVQGCDATPYRGQCVRFRAAVRLAETAALPEAQLWIRADCPGGRMGSFDNMDGREIIGTEWADYEVLCDVPSDAEGIALGIILGGAGEAFMDDVSLEIIGEARTPPVNAGFEDGELGSGPSGWIGGGGAYSVEVTREGPHSGLQCAKLLGDARAFDDAAIPVPGTAERSGSLVQLVDSGPFRGKQVRLRAHARLADVTPAPRAHLVFDIDRPGGKDAPGDNAPPVAGAEWAPYEIVVDVADDAMALWIGVELSGTGEAFIDDVSLEVVE